MTEGDAILVGIFTWRDAVGRMLAEGWDPATTTLAEVMTPNPDTMIPTHEAIEALRLMHDARCRHLPIVEDGSVVGIVSHGDFCGTGPARGRNRPMGADRLMYSTEAGS